MGLSTFLKSLDIFADLSDREWFILDENAQGIEYAPDAAIIKRGEIGRFLWIIQEGEVKVIQPPSGSAGEITILLKTGSLFGEMSIMTGEPAIADVVAATTCRLIKIPRETLSKLIAGNPKTLGKFARLITERMLSNARISAQHDHQRSAYRLNEDPYDLNFSSASEPLKILVLNSGSSSLKYSLFDTIRNLTLIEGAIEKIGSGDAAHHIRTPQIKHKDAQPDVMTMNEAFDVMIRTLTNPEFTAIDRLSDLNVVGHRVVHGGGQFSNAVVINENIMASIRSASSMAPLHNPYNLAGIERMQLLLPAVPQVAVFDTAFHQTMPSHAYTYALPHEVCERELIRRYGFHGTNHEYMALRASTWLKRPLGELKMISCHLGNGASLCAIDHGRSIDTSMGMTPLEGLIMGTRPGDVDPGAIIHLMKNASRNIEDMDRMLNRESGLKGISGKNDMREILAGAEQGDVRCTRAISAFCYRTRKYIGAYMAALGGLDVLIFTAGIGANSSEIRAGICQGLDLFGIRLSHDRNLPGVEQGGVLDISVPDAKVRILVIPADEERMIARKTLHALCRVRTIEETRMLRSKPVPISVSAHHVHLSQPDFERLFGQGKTMTPRSDLSQPNQFACQETVNLIGPKGKVNRVRILGPSRKESQVEISRTEEFQLGIDAPVRESGDLAGTPGITIEGEAGRIELEKGVICAKRHIHMPPEDALGFGLRNRDVVRVGVRGERELIFGDVVIRIDPNFKLDMHIDTDEANAAEISVGASGVIDSIQHRCYM
jgi:acetate kinase